MTEYDFWAFVKEQPSGCWHWTRGRTAHGYGIFRENGKLIYSHRRAWELINGPIPEGVNICHKCDNPPCCNPDHLFPGTQKDNIGDCIAKGRFDFKHLALVPQRRGEDNPGHKLTEAKVRKMRKLHSSGFGYKRLSQRFGVSFGVAQRIVNRLSWAHVK